MAQAGRTNTTRRMVLGSLSGAPVAITVPTPASTQCAMPQLPEGFIWVSVRETSWNALLEAAHGLQGL